MISKEHSVCFSGYRTHKFSETDDLADIQSRLAMTILQYIQRGCHTFISGMADGFDMMAAEEVIKIKKSFPHITFIAAIPCHNWREFTAHEQRIFQQADDVVAIANHAGKKAYHARNRYLVDNASVLICYYSGTPGGTKYTINYAKQHNLEIVNIFNEFTVT